jgi:hypothetical protein
MLSDSDFDLALHAAGLDVGARPDQPQVTVLWSTSTPAQPVALLLESPEPLWRSRLEPQPTYDEDSTHILRWTLEAAPWLVVDELVKAGATTVAKGGAFVRRATGAAGITSPTLRALRDRAIAGTFSAAASVPVPRGALVERFVRDESGTRTLVLLVANARGAIVSLGLARNLHPLIDADVEDTPTVLLEIDLLAPPWEAP